MGALVLAGLVGIVVTYRLVDDTLQSAGGYRVWATLDNAQGLVPKSRVLMAGIPVGTIDKISLEDGRARVDLRMDKDVPLYRDATLEKRSGSLLGENLLVLTPGAERFGRLADGDRIEQVLGGGTFDSISDNLGATSESVRRITEQLDRAFGTQKAGDQMAQALESLSEALLTINKTIDQNDEVVTAALKSLRETSESAGPRLVDVLDNLRRSSARVEDLLATHEGDIGRALSETDETVSAIREAAETLDSALHDIREVTERTAEGKGTIGRLTKDEKLVDDVEDVVDDIGDIIGVIGRLQTIVELRTEYNVISNALKSYVSLRLQPREDRYYLIEVVDDPRGLRREVLTEVETNPPPDGTPAFYTERRTITQSRFRFSLMFAQRVKFLTLRFGILESTGGLGLITHLLNDSLEFHADLFAMSENDLPRLRFRVAYEVLHKFWILAGIDDAMNDSSDFFLGAMLRFNDEDLKSILPFVGGAVPSS